MNRVAFSKAIKKARDAANQAARERQEAIAENPLWSECGGAHLRLDASTEKERRFFDSLIEKPMREFEIRVGAKGHYFVSISGIVAAQEMTVGFSATLAALAVFESELGIKGKAVGYLS